MGKKKKFIEKKKSATFHLLARDSSDPNYGETPGSDRVFVRVDNNHQYSVDTFFHDDDPGGEDPDSIFADAPDDSDDDVTVGAATGKAPPLPEHVRKEILELGFPDDGYNYLLHLREIRNTGGGSYYYRNPKTSFDQLPRDVKAYDASKVRVSEVDGDDANDNSIYSVASKTVDIKVQKILDPEVAALLDNSDVSRVGSDVEDLEEDFVVRANVAAADDNATQLGIHYELNSVHETSEHVTISGGRETVVEDDEEEKAKVGTDPGDGKQRAGRLLDEQFDMLERQEYGTDDEDDDYGGHYSEDESLAKRLNHVLNDNAMNDNEVDDKYEVPSKDIISRCVEYAEKYENENGDTGVVIVEESSDESDRWDCETIVSTYSNLENHPAKIETPGTARKKKLAETVSGALNAKGPVITLHGKEKLPLDFLPQGRKTDREKIKAVPEVKTEPLKRKQHGQESKEEKKERKAAVKKEKSEARRMKKEIKGLYRGEAQRAQRAVAVAGPSSIRLL